MRTMFFADEMVYTNCGYDKKYSTRGKFDTFAEAREKVATFPRHHENSGYDIGTWRIVKKTMDETTFTLTEEVVETHYWDDDEN